MAAPFTQIMIFTLCFEHSVFSLTWAPIVYNKHIKSARRAYASARSPGRLYWPLILHVYMAASCTQRMIFYIWFWTFSFQLNMGADGIKQACQICQESARARSLLSDCNGFWYSTDMAASCTQRMNFYIGFWTFSFQFNMGADCIQQAYQICQESARALSWQIVMVFDTPRIYGRALHPENELLHLVLNIQFST